METGKEITLRELIVENENLASDKRKRYFEDDMKFCWLFRRKVKT